MTTEVESILSQAKNKRHLKQQKTIQTFGYILVWTCGVIAVAAVFWIIGYVLSQGLPVIDLEFLTTRPAGACRARVGCPQRL